MDKLLTNVDWNQMLEATGETLYMTAIAARHIYFRTHFRIVTLYDSER